TQLLVYAAAKILGTQFYAPLYMLDMPIGRLSGFWLTWVYYAHSSAYGLFLAFAQIATSLCFFFRRTTRLGLMIFLPLILNIALIDFAYDIPSAKGMAVTLLLMGLYLLAADLKAFRVFFVDDPGSSMQPLPRLLHRFHRLKYLVIPTAIAGAFGLIFMLR